MKRILFIILTLFFIVGISFAEVYKWVDEKGLVCFTDDILQVPEKYRSHIEKIGLPEEKGKTKVEGESAVKGKEEAYKDGLGRGEEYWKGQMEEWKKKLRELQNRLEVLRAKYNELTEKFNYSRSTGERGNIRRERDQIKNEIDQCRIQIEEARNMIEKKIPEEAELFKAKPEWVKQ
jgi:chromosome segregation ATPase